MKVIKNYDFDLGPESVILDFGCGSGNGVLELRKNGFQAFGCDIDIESETNTTNDSMVSKGIIRSINLNPYILPFKDNTFDFIFSQEVFEHVKNYSEALSEISRVLKPDGVCLHLFPSRYKPIEVHVFVPFSSIIQSYWWLYFWTFLGVRNEFQKSLSTKERAIRDYNYLKDKTNYLSKSNLRKHFGEYFNDVLFCEKEFLRISQRGRFLYAMSQKVPLIPSVYSTLRSRVILTRSPKKAIKPTQIDNLEMKFLKLRLAGNQS